MAGKTGNQKIIEQFLADGMDHMFGNPGTVEQGFLDAMEQYPAMKYILTLQESIAVLTADGYARASQKPTLVQLHSSPGIGNAVGALYQAKRGHSPLVVIGGDAGVKYMNMDAQMANDLVAMMAPVTKFATVVTDSRSVLRTLRRAIKIAGTPPMGPVYVCLPMDVLDQINNEEVFPSSIPSTRVSPEDELIKQTAEILLSAEKPMIFVGDGVAYSGASAELTRVAELLGAEVYGVEFGDFLMDNTHPLYQGSTGHMFGSASYPITSKGDANLIVGTYMVPEVFPNLDDIYAPGAKVIHFDLNAYEIGKNHRVDIGVVSDPKLSLAALANTIESLITTDQTFAAHNRINELAKIKSSRLLAEKESDKKNEGSSPLHMSEFAKKLAEKLPADTIIFDEALTNSPPISRYMAPSKPGSYYFTRGGSLGVGIPGAIGVKIKEPNKTVIGFTGDGGSMYTIQALWSAVRHNVGAKFIICNNATYHLLQLNIDQYWKEQSIQKHQFPTSFDLSYPALHFDQIAKSLGVDSIRVEKSEDIDAALDRMFADDKPFLIDLVLEGEARPDKVNIKCGQ
jgi:benzoylformate decarboxylase